MKKHILTGLLALGICALPMTGVASAQQTTNANPNGTMGGYGQHMEQEASRATSGTNWGWLGLLGLAGLAGLKGRKHEDETVRRPYRPGEPLSSR